MLFVVGVCDCDFPFGCFRGCALVLHFGFVGLFLFGGLDFGGFVILLLCLFDLYFACLGLLLVDVCFVVCIQCVSSFLVFWCCVVVWCCGLFLFGVVALWYFGFAVSGILVVWFCF